MVQPKIERHGPIEAWIIDDTGLAKKGRRLIDVARQYCGQLGEQDICQVAVSLSIANHHASFSIAHRLYLSQSWAEEEERRKAGAPKDVSFTTKPEIALEQIRLVYGTNIERGMVLNAGYGAELRYVAGILPKTSVWPPGMGSLAHYEGRGWRGFNYHATLCIAAYGFLISRKGDDSLLTTLSACARQRICIFKNQKPRGAPTQNRASLAAFDRHHPAAPREHWLGGYVDAHAA